jgi:hypothetical protein
MNRKIEHWELASSKLGSPQGVEPYRFIVNKLGYGWEQYVMEGSGTLSGGWEPLMVCVPTNAHML